MWVHRRLHHEIHRAVSTRPAIVLTGPRQTGKSSLLQHLLPRHHYVSLDLPTESTLADQDPAEFLRRHPAPLIIDEVQYSPKLFRYLKVAIDRNRDAKGLYVLTGSQKFTLMHEVTDSLAGRVEILELESLAAPEILDAHGPVPVEEIVYRGGYPELWRDRSLASYHFYRSYTATYLERDVRNLLQVSSLRDFERFLRACALRSGQILNKADLARDVGISAPTANEWLSVLQTSGHVVLLEPYFSNKTKSLIKSPKLYLADTGLLSVMLNLESVDDLRKSPHAGAIWETFVFSELRKREAFRTGRWSIHYWKSGKHEVDFVVDRGPALELYEAKWTEYPDENSDAAGLLQLTEALGKPKPARRAIVARAEQSYPLANGVTVENYRSLTPAPSARN